MNIKVCDIIQYVGGEEIQLPCCRFDSKDYDELVWVTPHCPLFVTSIVNGVVYADGFGDEGYMIPPELISKFAKFNLVKASPTDFELNTYYRVRAEVTVYKLDRTYERCGKKKLAPDDIVFVADEFEDTDSVVAMVLGSDDVEILALQRDAFEKVNITSAE